MPLKAKNCDHLNTFDHKAPTEYVCEKCIQTGDEWVHLRTCQTCGVTLCCDASKNKHATKHFQETGHPVIISAEPGERWAWCYIDKQIKMY